jgi:hypothetical protein
MPSEQTIATRCPPGFVRKCRSTSTRLRWTVMGSLLPSTSGRHHNGTVAAAPPLPLSVCAQPLHRCHLGERLHFEVGERPGLGLPRLAPGVCAGYRAACLTSCFSTAAGDTCSSLCCRRVKRSSGVRGRIRKNRRARTGGPTCWPTRVPESEIIASTGRSSRRPIGFLTSRMRPSS